MWDHDTRVLIVCCFQCFISFPVHFVISVLMHSVFEYIYVNPKFLTRSDRRQLYVPPKSRISSSTCQLSEGIRKRYEPALGNCASEADHWAARLQNPTSERFYNSPFYLSNRICLLISKKRALCVVLSEVMLSAPA